MKRGQHRNKNLHNPCPPDHSPVSPMESLLCVGEVVQFLGRSRSTVYRYIQKGMPYYKMGRKYSFRKEDINEWLSHHKRMSFLVDKILKKALTSPSKIHIDKAEGGQTVARVSKTRHNYGYGIVYKRKHCRFWSIDYRDAKGKRIQEVVKGATSQHEAHEALKRVVLDTHFGEREKFEPRKPVTFDKLADMYIEDHAKINKPGSWRTDQGRVKEMKMFFMGRSADSITSQDIEQYKAFKKGQDRRLSTVNKHVQILSKLFNCGISWGHLKENPCKGIKKYREDQFRRTRVLTRKEEARLLKAIGPEHIKSMVKIFLNAGLRRKELFQLSWQHVDFKKRQLFLKETKTGRSRYIPMNETVYNELRELQWSRSDDGLVYHNPKTGKGYVCIRKTFNRACKTAKIGNLNLLDLRRTFATRLLEASADIVTVQQLLGHTSVMTTQIYTMTNQEQKRHAVSLLDPKKVQSGDNFCDKKRGLLVNYGFSVN